MDDERFYELVKEAAMLAKANLNANGFQGQWKQVDSAASARIDTLLKEVQLRQLMPVVKK